MEEDIRIEEDILTDCYPEARTSCIVSIKDNPLVILDNFKLKS